MQRDEHRLVVVCNPNSTDARHVQKEVLAPLAEAGIPYETFITRHTATANNIDDLATIVSDGDYIISAAGDSTAMQLANAALRSQRDVTIGFLPYGNFNDAASAHVRAQDTILDLIKAPSIDMQTLSVSLDDVYWRDAVSHATLGWTAVAASEFSERPSRNRLKKTPQSLKLSHSLLQLTGNYIRHGNKYLPPFSTNNEPAVRHKTTDIIAINSPRIAGIVRSPHIYYDDGSFGYTEVSVANMFYDAYFAIRAISGNTPLRSQQSVDVEFTSSTFIPIQLDGEAEQVTASKVSIYKDPHHIIRVLHTRG